MPDTNASGTNSALSEVGRLQTTDDSVTASGITSTGGQNQRTSSTTSATTKESDVVLPTSSISFNTALAGLLISDDATLDKDMIAKSIEQVPTNSGVWVPASERKDILNLLNAASAYPFTIDQDGYVHKIRDSILDSQKSLTFYNKIDTLISGQNRTILSISSSYWSYNESSHTIAKQTISNSVSVVFQNSRILILDRAHFVPKSQNTYATLAISMLKALYKDGSDCTVAVSKELSSLLGQSQSSSSDSTMLSSPNGVPSQRPSDSSSNSNQTQSNASSGISSSPKKDTGNSQANSIPQTSSFVEINSPQISSSASSTSQVSGKTESASSFTPANSSGRGDNTQDEQQNETSSNTVSSYRPVDIEKDHLYKTNIASTESTDSGSMLSSSKISSNSDASSVVSEKGGTGSSSSNLSSTVSLQSNGSQLPSQSGSPSVSANSSSITVSTPASNIISDTDSNHSDAPEIDSNTQVQSRTFDVALAGLLEGKKHALSRTDIDGIVKGVPTSNGIWIPATARKTMLDLINSLSSKPFEIDPQGYLQLKANEPEDQTKSVIFAEKLLSLINGQECIILSPTTEIWYDGGGGPAPSPSGFGDAYSVQIQGETSRLILLNGSLFKIYGTSASNVTVSSLLLNQLLENGTNYSTLINKELSAKSSKLVFSAFSINIAAGGTMTSAQTTYAGPGGSIYAQVGSVDNGEYINIIDFEQGWLYIEYGTTNGSKRGYVPSGNVSYSGSVPTADYHGGYYNAPNANLSVYYLPTVNGLSAGSIYAYEGATVLETNGSIAYIEYSSPSGTKRGYVWTSQLCNRHDGVMGIVTASSTPVYAGTDTHFASVGSIDRTEYTVILKTSGQWAFVEYNTPSGRKRGYTWIENIGDHYSLGNLPPIQIIRNLGVATTAQNAYAGPNTNYAQMGSVFAGDQVNIITENEYGWCYVEYYTGGSASKRGYVDINSIQHISLGSLPTPSGISAITYGTSSSQRPLNAYKLGNGPNVLFGVFEQHGFEDGWAADGVELVKIANNLIANLNGNGNLSKWTVYVIPSANPDGLLSGYTNNGFGRCTSAWVDMNRSHNTDPLAYYTDDRNRTNHNAPEVINLENFVNQRKSGSGQNVLLDVHGWENSTLGDPTVSRYFDNALGLNHVSNSGSDGYLIKWGMQNGINSTLVELPLPANPQDVINRNLSGKFISAVNNLLANTGVPASSTSAPEGWLDVVDGNHIAGWARDRNNLADSIWVHIYIRNRSTQAVAQFAATLAKDYRSDVAPGSHGFSYAVDWRTIPPGEYQIETYAIGQNGNNPPLSGTPKFYTVNASSGCVDYVDSRGVGGWAWKSSAPNLPIDAHVYVYDLNGTQLYGVPVTANQYRSDLASSNYGNGYHGFSASIPWDYLPQGQLRIVAYAVDGSGANVQIYNQVKINPYIPDYSYTTMGHYLSKLTDAVNYYKSKTGNLLW